MFYSQRNPCWSGDNLGFGPTTIGDYGCVITSFGMGLGVNPSVVNDRLKRVNGYTGSNKNLVIWRKVEEAFPELKLKHLVHCVTIPAPVDIIDKALRSNDLVLVRIDMNLHKRGIQHHWLYVFGGNSEDGYKVYDPWARSDEQYLLPPIYSKRGWNAARAIYSVVIYSRKQIAPPPPPPPPPVKPLGELVTLHLQTPVRGWWDYVNEAKTEWVKTVGNFELNVPPNTKLLIRQYLSANDQQKYLDGVWDAGHFLDRFWDSIVANASRIKAVEGLNETIATGDMPGIMKAVRFEVSFAVELARRCKEANIDVKACLLNTAVGNPQHGYEVEKLVPVARIAVRYGGYIGYHSYFPCHATFAEQWVIEEGRHHHERAIYSWDPVFAKHGVAPRYLFTEAGAIGMAARPDGRPSHYDPNAGWRASIDAERYAKLLVMVRNRLNNWNLSHGNRVESMMIFTSGEGVGWKSFQFKNPQMQILLKVL